MYEKLIDRMRNWAASFCGCCRKSNKTQKVCDDCNAVYGDLWRAADAIEELRKPRWIPVTEELPIRGDRVICFGDNGINIVDFVCGDKWCALPWFYLDGEQETGVTHWMPLPEPPKGE